MNEVDVLSEFISDKRKNRIEDVLHKRSKCIIPVLYDLYDPHNIGAIFRTTEAFGFHEIHVIEESHVEKWPQGVTQGADRWLQISWYRNFEESFHKLHNQGYEIYAADMYGTAITEIDFDKPLAIVFGNEHQGVPQKILQQVDKVISIPMWGFSQSLNVSVSAAITMNYIMHKFGTENRMKYRLSEEEKEKLRRHWYKLACKHAESIMKSHKNKM